MILPLALSVAGAAPPTSTEAAALWAAASTGAADTTWVDTAGVEPAWAHFTPGAGIHVGGEPRGRSALGQLVHLATNCQPPGTIIPVRPLTVGLTVPGWPAGKDVREVAFYDLGCPAERELSAAVLTRTEGGAWRIVQIVGPDGLERWSDQLRRDTAPPAPSGGVVGGTLSAPPGG